MRWFALLLALALWPQSARAEDCPFAQYAYARETGQIQVTTGSMERTADLDARKPAMEKGGLVVLEAEVLRTFTRHERVGSHEVTTTITIAPPAGHGEGGASSNADLRVVVDKDTLVACPLSYPYVVLDKIAVDPDRRYVTLVAHERILYFDGFESSRVIDEDWLNDRAEAMRKLLCGAH